MLTGVNFDASLLISINIEQLFSSTTAENV